MDDEVSSLRAAWRLAASDLGVEVDTMERYETDPAGVRHRVVAHLPDFGGQNGMLIFVQPIFDRSFSEALQARGFGYTTLGSSYGDYTRASFAEMLKDWTWTGDGPAPS